MARYQVSDERIALVLEVLMAWEARLQQMQVQAAESDGYEMWHERCIMADVTVAMALERVADLLPSEVREVVKRLVASRKAVWSGSEGQV